jgi:ankyrin repeat protein
MEEPDADSRPESKHIQLVQACAAGREDLVRQLLESDPWSTQKDRECLGKGLQRVAARNNVSLCHMLLQKGAPVDPRPENSNEISALFRAAENGYDRVVKILIEHHANLEALDRYGRTPLFPAALKGHVEVVSTLIKANAKVNARDNERRTVINHIAAERLVNWNQTICQILIEANADLEAGDSRGTTPLIWAAATGKLKMVEFLLKETNTGRVNVNRKQ